MKKKIFRTISAVGGVIILAEHDPVLYGAAAALYGPCL